MSLWEKVYASGLRIEILLSQTRLTEVRSWVVGQKTPASQTSQLHERITMLGHHSQHSPAIYLHLRFQFILAIPKQLDLDFENGYL